MSVEPQTVSDARARTLRNAVSRAALLLAVALLAGSWLLISPPQGRTYPGSKPWGEFSLLRTLTELMSLGGSLETARGVEIKDFAFHLCAGLGLLLLAIRAVISARWTLPEVSRKRAWFHSQALLAAWVGLSLASAKWSGDEALSLGQAALFGLAVAWAVALAWTLEMRDLPKLLAAVVGVSAVGALLCVWYFYERNPYHNPGFPLGAPGTLGACTLPATLIILCVLVGTPWRDWRRWTPGQALPIAGAVLALIPLVWCLALTGSLAARVGLVVGLVAVAFMRLGRLGRRLIGVVAVLLIVAAGWWTTTADFGRFTADRPTIRFRMYAWRYATEMWQTRQVLGVGAGAYTRFARYLGVGDRALDPGAFMGDWTGHAHNELFETLAEIGLIGGLTFVGGFVGAAIALLRLLRMNLSTQRRWQLIGLGAGLAALAADAMFDVGLRLPGEPAVFFTLLGALWAACRCASRQPGELGGQRPLPGRGLRRAAVAAVSLLAAVAAFGLAGRNWSGVLNERDSLRYLEQAARADSVSDADPLVEAALSSAALAEGRLLDPVRSLFAAAHAARCKVELAELAVRASPDPQTTTRPATDPAFAGAYERALARAHSAYYASVAVDGRAPGLLRSRALAARAAELAAQLYAPRDAGQARHWAGEARAAWALQRQYDPFDVDALLALQKHLPLRTDALPNHIALLRDALRAGDPQPDRWSEALRTVAAVPGFEQTLAVFVTAADPIHPETGLDHLVASMAPELYRLVGHWLALHDRYDDAVQAAARAAGLYAPMRQRFPMLPSVALAEQAEFAILARPDDAVVAVALVQQAIDLLPLTQEQKYEEMLRPFRMRLGTYLLMAGREPDALAVLTSALEDPARARLAAADIYAQQTAVFIRRPRESRPPVRTWLTAALRLRPDHLRAWSWLAWLDAEDGDAAAVARVLGDAARAGVPPDAISLIRNSLCQEFPGLCDQLRAQE